MCLQTTLVLKDFIPLIGTAIVTLMGYYGISVQVRKNRRAKWIEDFRREVSKMPSLILRLQDKNDLQEIFYSIVLINMFLDAKNKKHDALIRLIAETQQLIMLKANPNYYLEVLPDLILRSYKIIDMAKDIVADEQRKI